MAELKRNFSGGKMNKDMDERVLAPGQYRDANNVQVMTSDGSDTGSLQTLLGNTNVTEDTVYTFIDPTISKVVGVKSLPEEDKVYFMVYSGADVAAVPVGTPQKDYIVEYNTVKKTTDFVFVDIHAAQHTVTTACDDGTKVFKIKGGDQSWAHGIRVGMNLSGTFNDGSGSTVNINSAWNVKVTKIRYFASYWWIHHDYANAVGSSIGDVITFTAPRVLKFNPHNVIHSIDITSNMMFWTDNQNEPRKIHLERSKRGTGGTKPLKGRSNLFYHNTMPPGVMTDATFSDVENTGLFHTRLVKRASSTSTQLVQALNRTKDQPTWVKEDHITVIKKSPTNALTLVMQSNAPERIKTTTNAENALHGVTTPMSFFDSTPELLSVGDNIDLIFQNNIDLRVGDILLMTSEPGATASSFAVNEAEVRVTITSIPIPPGNSGPPNVLDNGANGVPFTGIINSIDSTIPNVPANWAARVEQEKAMFEFKFPRFSYRWRYQDGEYSTFAPWSEVAFLPGTFDYLPKKGFNLGMSNRLRYLKLKDYMPEWGTLPEDVVEVDLLYKEAGKKTVYTVKSLKPQDLDPIWPDQNLNPYERGEFEIKSELIHAVVPSNQLLRPWDNVPRLAKTQVMTGNRLVYGNYIQNYNVDSSLVMSCSLRSYTIPDSPGPNEEEAKRSVKSIRSYQVGVVWSDKYGRETPVMVPKEGGSITIDKKDCVKQNYISAKIQEDVPRPPWAEFVSYYIKETSNEYYNLAMDRFYNAEDGNIWISFPSAERNKVQADTYLYLKKGHDSDEAVTEKARYRVVAVENEAPLFIKATKKSFGFESLEFKASGLPEPGRKFIIVNDNHFVDHFDSTINPTRLDNLQIRVGGVAGSEVLLSELYNVVNISKNSSQVKIVLEKRLGDELAPISVLDRTLDMKLEVIQNKFEDKPEFDGRFFVKILKDITLEKELLSTINSTTDYGVTTTLNVGFGCDADGMDKNNWFDWNDSRGGGNQSTGSRWFLDDIDSFQDDIDTHRWNHGGIYNWPLSGGVATSSANGYMDLSMVGWTHGSIMSNGGYTSMNTLFSNIGQLFRFKADPAQVVFKVTGFRDRIYRKSKYGDSVLCNSELDYTDSNGNNKNENGNSSGQPLVGGENDAAWNYHSSSKSWENNRASFRVKVDKCFGSGPNHLMDTSTMARMTYVDANGDTVEIPDGQRYDGAIVGGTVSTAQSVNANVNGNGNSGGTSNTWNVGDYHNWYPITSDTGVILNTANQLEAASYAKINDNTSIFGQGQSNIVHHSPIRHTKMSKSHAYYGKAFHSYHNSQKAYIEIEFLEPVILLDDDGGVQYSSNNPAIWETEPKEDIGLDIYYEASAKIPLNPDHTQNELLIPIGSRVFKMDYSTYLGRVGTVNSVTNKPYVNTITLYSNLPVTIPHGGYIRVERPDKTVLCLCVNNPGGAASGQPNLVVITGENAIDLTTGSPFSSERAPWHNPMLLGWSNCWAFGNGVEADRIRDDYNAPQLDNGVKASTTLATPYEEELRSSGMIFSGIFNSTSGVNDLNQFIMAEPITKDINPSYGTIQRMYARNTNTLVFCEDKVLNILTNKDAVFNADGNTNITASNKVLGNPTPIPGDFGISTNPESLAVAPSAMYWCDPIRGKVLKLEGNTTIKVLSDVGMKDYFNDTLVGVSDVIGTYDQKKKDYNISIGKKVTPSQVFSTKTTITYSEVVKGWTSFKSFEPEMGVSLNNEYYTFKNGQMWQHHVSETIDYTPAAVPPNNFYGVQYYPDVTLFINDNPGSVKSFNTLNYEGTQSRITAHLTDPDYYNLTAKTGWYVDSLTTDLQEIGQLEFKSKEGKWFSTIKGVATNLSNLDEREFSVQGLGNATVSVTGTPVTHSKLTVAPGTQSSNGTNWDTSADSVDWNFTGALTQTISSGTAYPASYKDAILHNITFNQGGALVYSGLDLDASSFAVPGATVTSTGTGNSTVYIYTAKAGWNADTTFSSGDTVSDGITKVEFTNVGVAGDPANTVRARIHYHGFTAGATQKNLFVDIDNGGSTSAGGGVYRNACVKVHYNQTINANGRTVTVTQTDVPNITETNIDGFDPNGHSEKSNRHEAPNGVLEGQTTKLAEYKIEAGGSDYLSPQSNGKGVKTEYHNHLASSPWQSYYSYNVTDTMHTSTGNTNKIKSTLVEIFYTPPVGVLGLDPDPVSPEGGWCTFLQCVELTWFARQITAIPNTANTLNTMSFAQATTTGNANSLRLSGNAAGNVQIGINNSSSQWYQLGAINQQNEYAAGSWVTREGNTPLLNTVALDNNGNLTIPVELPTSTTLSTITAFASVSTTNGTDLTLSSSIPTASSRISSTQQDTISVNALVTSLANTTRTPVRFQAFEGIPLSVVDPSTPLTKNISIVYLANSNATIAINRQPTDADISGGNKLIQLAVGSAGGRVLTVSAQDVVGLTAGMSVSESGRSFSQSLPVQTSLTQLTFSIADYNEIFVGQTITGGNIPSGTTVQSKTSPGGGIGIVTLSAAETSKSPAYTSFSFSGRIAPGSVIASISGANITLDRDILDGMDQFDFVSFGNGMALSAQLNVVMLETPASTSGGVITTVNNKKALVTGTIQLSSFPASSSSISINPNFLTVTAT